MANLQHRLHEARTGLTIEGGRQGRRGDVKNKQHTFNTSLLVSEVLKRTVQTSVYSSVLDRRRLPAAGQRTLSPPFACLSRSVPDVLHDPCLSAPVPSSADALAPCRLLAAGKGQVLKEERRAHTYRARTHNHHLR